MRFPRSFNVLLLIISIVYALISMFNKEYLVIHVIALILVVLLFTLVTKVYTCEKSN